MVNYRAFGEYMLRFSALGFYRFETGPGRVHINENDRMTLLIGTESHPVTYSCKFALIRVNSL
jgi:hypothetical protein